MIVLSTKSCSVREIMTLEQENNAMKFCLHYCLHWNIPLMFHFSSCVTRHTMSCSNLPSDSVFERSPSSLIVYYLALILHQVLWSVYILCVRELYFWLTIIHSIRWIYDNGAGFLVIIDLCGYRKRKESRRILVLRCLWSNPFVSDVSGNSNHV